MRIMVYNSTCQQLMPVKIGRHVTMHNERLSRAGNQLKLRALPCIAYGRTHLARQLHTVDAW